MIYNPEAIGLKVISYSSDEAHCICPFHHDTRPSASFNLKSGQFYCFSCGTGYSSAIYLAHALHGTVEKVDSYEPEKAKFTKEKLWSKLLWNKLAIDNEYLKSRNVSNETVKTFRIQENERGVIFPIYNADEMLVGCHVRQYKKFPKYLTFGEKFPIWPKHVEPLSKDNTLIVEGVFGVLNCYRHGIQAYAAIGAMIKKEIGNYVFQKQVLGFFDNDLAGYIAGARLLRFIPRAKIIVPGAEVDELSNANLIEALYNKEQTRYLPQLAELSGNKMDFYRYLPKV
jgi:DNA primase